MKSFQFIFIAFFAFNAFITAWAENAYYVVSVKRDENDKNFDNESEETRIKIVELVNERMNDIYNIIEDNIESYRLENGEMDEKLNEINEFNSSSLKKRQFNKPFKYAFKNHNRPKYDLQNIIKNKKRSLDSNYSDSNIEYVSNDSNLVSYICPILNYYAIRAYLSNSIVEKVLNLNNIKRCEKASRVENSNVIHRNIVKLKDLFKHMIKEETKWKGVSVQEQTTFNKHNFFAHLSLLSQSKFYKENTGSYDNNYYYPESAGQGINIYLIDSGIDRSFKENYDTYEGTPYERTITCDTVITDGKSHPRTGDEQNFCEIYDYIGSNLYHGVAVSSVAAGTIFGAAKKANIHMIATDYLNYDTLAALDFIRENGTPHKTVINYSRGGWSKFNEDLQNKINELTEEGYIIFAAVGNDSQDACSPSQYTQNIKYLAAYDNVIVIGATENTFDSDINNGFKVATYSDYGKCIDFYAPGQALFPYRDKKRYVVNDQLVDVTYGTSISSALVAGVAATIMSDNEDIEYNYEIMYNTLLELSIKDVLTGFRSFETPNRLINNGKRLVFSPTNEYHGCGRNSPVKSCSQGCCSKYGTCIDPSDDQYDLCYIGRDCQLEFGECHELPATSFIPEPEPTLYVDPPVTRPKIYTKNLPTDTNYPPVYSRKNSTTSSKTLRNTSKTLRTSSKTLRTSSKTLRISSKTLSTSSKTLRISSKTLRTSSKTLRISSKTLRISSKTLRISSKTLRNTSKTLRTSSKTLRISSKTPRISSKTLQYSKTLSNYFNKDQAYKTIQFPYKTVPTSNAIQISSKTIPFPSKTVPTTITITTTATTIVPSTEEPNNIDYYCEQNDWECKSEQSSLCYLKLSECWQNQDQYIECEKINEQCSNIWN
ncbi:subtilisin-like protein [Anaeromyces robustus]|uniref:Subtilisin-like protein n=1 Tax=Anaeromyces robustus TaxID=1754192 RepID=A0A1Y1X3K0_9FUNG|nr:subtilisin-like protein [Anaeromyces robustus]|eukprot:ORX80245.1 subtilisin-like protein [Anaeromyces robustus]